MVSSSATLLVRQCCGGAKAWRERAATSAAGCLSLPVIELAGQSAAIQGFCSLIHSRVKKRFALIDKGSLKEETWSDVLISLDHETQ